MWLWDFEEELTPGDYRIVKMISAEDEPPFPVYANFTIVEQAEPFIPDQTGISMELSNYQIGLHELNDSLRMTYTIHNQSARDLDMGTDYAVDKYDVDSEQWVNVPFPADSVWTLELIPVPAGESRTLGMSLTGFRDKLTTGDYRLVKRLNARGEPDFALYAGFSIVAPIQSPQDGAYIVLGKDRIKADEINDMFVLSYRIYNTGTKDLSVDALFTVEKFDRGQWTTVPFAENLVWPPDVIPILAGKTIETSVNLSYFENELTEGDYRLVKKLSVERDSKLTLYANFTILEKAEIVVIDPIGNPTLSWD
jgi:hypothetical protein